MKITNFYSGDARAFQQEAKAAIQALAAKYQISLEEEVRPDPTGYQLKLGFTCGVKGEDGSVKRSPGFQAALDRYNLSADDIGYENGVGYKLTGYSASRPKYPWDIQRVSDGKNFRCPQSMASRLFGKYGGAR